MKKTNSPKKKLQLKKETIRTLDSKEMQQAQGAATPSVFACPRTDFNCPTDCCSLNGGNNHNQTFLRRRGR